jgi:hypothetical protein
MSDEPCRGKEPHRALRCGTGADRRTADLERPERHLPLLRGALPPVPDFLPALMDLRRDMTLIDFADALHGLIGQWCEARSRDV